MEHLDSNQAPTDNLLDDISVNLVQANGNLRFVNLLVDHIVLYLLWKFLLGRIVGVIIVFSGLYTEDRTLFLLESYVFVIIFDVLIFAGQEALMGGKTIGKFVTGTRAINSDGAGINFKTALLRSLSRIVPFEAFSALSSPCYPWHDRWTGTLVINEKLSRLPL